MRFRLQPLLQTRYIPGPGSIDSSTRINSCRFTLLKNVNHVEKSVQVSAAVANDRGDHRRRHSRLADVVFARVQPAAGRAQRAVCECPQKISISSQRIRRLGLDADHEFAGLRMIGSKSDGNRELPRPQISVSGCQTTLR